jgi:hypothetical protein
MLAANTSKCTSVFFPVVLVQGPGPSVAGKYCELFSTASLAHRREIANAEKSAIRWVTCQPGLAGCGVFCVSVCMEVSVSLYG